MSDFYLDMGDDLQFTASGDFLAVTDAPGDPALTHQRIGRRFFTNPKEVDGSGNVTAPADYIFHPNYGAGLPRLIDANTGPQSSEIIQMRMQSQALAESTIAQNPTPTATVTVNGNEVSCLTTFTPLSGGTSQVSFGYTP
jgi:hypothetical protein